MYPCVDQRYENARLRLRVTELEAAVRETIDGGCLDSYDERRLRAALGEPVGRRAADREPAGAAS